METKNLWASPHSPTPEQIAEAGDFVFLRDLNSDLQERLENSPTSFRELNNLAELLLDYCRENHYNLYQPAGNPSFQFALGWTARQYGDVDVYYAYSIRESQEVIQPDGSIKKIAVFRHKEFIRV